MNPRTTMPLFTAAAVAAACGGCSSASRIASRGWEYDSAPTQVAANSVRVYAPQASAQPMGDGQKRIWHDPVGRPGSTTRTGMRQPEVPQPAAPQTAAQAAAAAPPPGASMAAELAAAEIPPPRRPQQTAARSTPGHAGDLPTINDAFDRPDGRMADAIEGLSQITFAGDGAAFDPCVSRDGRFVAFAGTQHRPTADIYIKPISGSAVTQLTADPAHDIMPSISPDGQRIAFASNRGGNWDVYVMSAGGGQAVQLTSDPANDLHPSWSPDGGKLVFCRLGQVSGRWELWVQDFTQSRAAEFIGYGVYPRWCPVGATGEGGRDKIAFQRARERGERAFSVWTIDYRPGDVTSPTEVASNPEATFINPDWSADGRWITYAAMTNPGEQSLAGRPDAADLWIVSVNGSLRVNLTSGNFVNLAPSWAADGRIYFVSNRAGVDNIWSVATDRALAAATAPAAAPATDDSSTGTAHVPTP